MHFFDKKHVNGISCRQIIINSFFLFGHFFKNKIGHKNKDNLQEAFIFKDLFCYSNQKFLVYEKKGNTEIVIQPQHTIQN